MDSLTHFHSRNVYFYIQFFFKTSWSTQTLNCHKLLIVVARVLQSLKTPDSALSTGMYQERKKGQITVC